MRLNAVNKTFNTIITANQIHEVAIEMKEKLNKYKATEIAVNLIWLINSCNLLLHTLHTTFRPVDLSGRVIDIGTALEELVTLEYDLVDVSKAIILAISEGSIANLHMNKLTVLDNYWFDLEKSALELVKTADHLSKFVFKV